MNVYEKITHYSAFEYGEHQKTLGDVVTEGWYAFNYGCICVGTNERQANIYSYSRCKGGVDRKVVWTRDIMLNSTDRVYPWHSGGGGGGGEGGCGCSTRYGHNSSDIVLPSVVRRTRVQMQVVSMPSSDKLHHIVKESVSVPPLIISNHRLTTLR